MILMKPIAELNSKTGKYVPLFRPFDSGKPGITRAFNIHWGYTEEIALKVSARLINKFLGKQVLYRSPEEFAAVLSPKRRARVMAAVTAARSRGATGDSINWAICGKSIQSRP